ncbi:hypothetical protein [Sulfuricurvum sp.]|uniref:hypothetical protein n=1 Tax=Sulfuricurvum sp. TaxID=2025608 RepID=UPI00260BD68B|nr:hypothetical protein [Sulfuricurvum sp.]MDD4884269.1 hypothetical protein [Sulfuricurvum sp.]
MRESTSLTPLKVAQKTTFLEWDSQPSLFKHYPAFCYRIDENPTLEWLFHVRSVTSSVMIGKKTYHRFNVPSAGNLHPIEMYVQIRNIAGVLDGIYHVDPLNRQIVLIREIERDGIERAIGLENRFNGFIVMFSLVPFRSFWKYGLRAWRYCYLDLGHQIGALCAVAHHFGLAATKLSDIQHHLLNLQMGMGEDEFIAAVYPFGESGKKPATALETESMRVSPCDYTQRERVLSDAIVSEVPYTRCIPETIWNGSISCSRRSAREFYPPAMEDDVLAQIVDTEHETSLEVVHIVLQAQTMQCGVYRNGVCTQVGNYSAEMVHLLLEQRFIAGASVISLIFGRSFDAVTHIEAGKYAHKLYLISEESNAGCSGIGAFYDDEALCWSANPLLYAVAIGGKV